VALCPGTVWHHRAWPAEHRFETRVSYVWLDPDRPDALTAAHPLWSHRRPAPARFRAIDYGANRHVQLGEQVRRRLEPVLGRRPDGPLRMLTQVRRWGWLFNPITLFVVWNADDLDTPVGAVIEVTNTPWKERHQYAVALARDPAGADRFTAEMPKVLHVSPFLDEQWDYVVRLSSGDPGSIALEIDVMARDSDEVIVSTMLRVDRTPVTAGSLTRALVTAFPTHRVSAGIHLQAARLWRKRVPFVAHPSKRPAVR
jgi:DUF1365 family protein